MNVKTIIMGILLLSGSFSHAGFECQEGAGLVNVTAVHEQNAYAFLTYPAKVVISTSAKEEVQMSAQVSTRNTRVGSQYHYKVPVDGIHFSVSEFSNLVKAPGCKPGGRITCDLDWSSTYVGYLTLNGKSYELDCQAL